MMQNLSLSEISHVIALATAPSFLLGAVVGFLSLLVVRAGRLSDHLRLIEAAEPGSARQGRLAAELPSLGRRARLVHLAIALSIVSGVSTALLVIVAFLGALLNLASETTVAILFVFGLVMFAGSLYLFAHEAILSLGEFRRAPTGVAAGPSAPP